jgi:hypothetical protein
MFAYVMIGTVTYGSMLEEWGTLTNALRSLSFMMLQDSSLYTRSKMR